MTAREQLRRQAEHAADVLRRGTRRRTRKPGEMSRAEKQARLSGEVDRWSKRPG